MEKMKSLLNKLLGISLLEYEDMNYLSGNVKGRAEEKIKMLRELIFLCEVQAESMREGN